MPVVGQHLGEAGRNVDERIAIYFARFDQRDGRVGVFSEITRNDAAGRAPTSDDNVVGFSEHRYPSFHAICIAKSTPLAGAPASGRLILRLVGSCSWKMTWLCWRGKS